MRNTKAGVGKRLKVVQENILWHEDVVKGQSRSQEEALRMDMLQGFFYPHDTETVHNLQTFVAKRVYLTHFSCKVSTFYVQH